MASHALRSEDNAGASRLDLAIFACLSIFAVSIVVSKAVTEIAYGAALALWFIKVFINGRRPQQSPLTWPLLAYLMLSAISTAFSPVPLYSWERMKSVALLIIAMLFAENVRTMRQVRVLALLLIASTVLSLGCTAWQYSYGLGARIERDDATLRSAGLIPGDIVVAVNGHSVHTPSAFEDQIGRSDAAKPETLQVNRGEWLEKRQVQIAARSPALAELEQPSAVGRAHPIRARGTLGTMVTYAEVLLQLTLVLWGLSLAALQAQQKLSWALAALMILTGIALVATLTRASLLSCFVGSVLVFWQCVPRAWARALSLVVVLIALLGASLVVRHQRKLGMIAREDAGTDYRVLMWQDGIRLTMQHPLLGIGMDSIKVRWREYGIRAYERYPLRGHFHSTPIQIAAERGLLTLAAWVWVIVVYLGLLLRLIKRIPQEDWFARGLVLGILGAAAGFVSSSFVHFNLGDSEVQMLFWFLMGLAIAMDRVQFRSSLVQDG
ncbi:MAG: O-antigen ligase family protein [Terriglobales bacterium]